MVGSRVIVASLVLGVTGLNGVSAAEKYSSSQLDQIQRQLIRQQEALRKTQDQLERQSRALDDTRKALERLRGKSSTAASSEQKAEPKSSKGSVAASPATGTSPSPVGRPPQPTSESQPAVVEAISDRLGVLTPRGKWVLEPSLEYSYATSNRVTLVGYTIIPAITVGVIDVREVNSATTVAAITSRYGITNHLEAEIKIPYVYRDDQSVTRPLNQGTNVDTVYNANGDGIGDVELAFRYQFNDGGQDRPYYVGTMRFKSRTGKGPFEVEYQQGSTSGTGFIQSELPTGSGFYGVQPGLGIIFPSDPAVFFGGVNYLWNIKRDVNRDIGGQHIGTVEPGDVLGFNLGMGLGLNERSSFGIGYEHSVVGKTRIDGQTSPDAVTTQLGTLLLNWGYRYGLTNSINLTLGAGLTRDTPDVQITLRTPFTFF
ncbi:acetate kinase [Mangrovitalea sediminis]|uniref:acetate kinase n=1 Tax=Mangrovitalea sediminis TaxID=1982043 RepID=UPI000BE5B6B6|nr:acetate kinase [Mangrovitalea sediminis]